MLNRPPGARNHARFNHDIRNARFPACHVARGALGRAFDRDRIWNTRWPRRLRRYLRHEPDDGPLRSMSGARSLESTILVCRKPRFVRTSHQFAAHLLQHCLPRSRCKLSISILPSCACRPPKNLHTAPLLTQISKELDVRLPNQLLMKLSCCEPSSIPEEFKARSPKTRPSQDCRLRAVRRCDVTRDTSDWRLPRRIRSAFTRSKVKLAHSAGDQTNSYPVLRIDRMRDPVRQSPWF